MKIIKLILGAFETNTYIVGADSKSAAVIDPASDADKILARLEKEELALTDILLTHGHFDHTAAVAGLKAAPGNENVKVRVHGDDAPMLSDKEKSFASLYPEEFVPCRADCFLEDGEVIKIGELSFSVLHTPGHSGGSVMFFCGNVIFSGDTIFECSAGRTDGWSGDPAAQRQSFALIKSLRRDFVILPGHGGQTTLNRERELNPFLR
ncbi:MAG: MBL fold metallo-hydrolase [Oscillospiraceae bacterium]|jgi:glyoxylase-like metal-dependent hydrolase (beta-lactamase superfamily II)|nr:MBL fold metallo-hydrolase [Oscillospiraceae bacterium]